MSAPLHTVKDKFGSKEALVDRLMPLLDRQPEESEEEFKDRLMRVSNRKLLRLFERENTLREQFGNRETLVDRIMELRLQVGRKANADLRRVLLTQSTGRLLSAHWGLTRAAKR